MKILKGISIVLVIIVVGIQFIPTTLNQSSDLSETDMIITYNIPDDLASILKISCYDCHSNNTQYPWYSKIQPGGWFMEGHIKDGKKELNFSEFGDYSDRRKKSKLKSMISQIKDGEMPLSSYTLIHRDAILSESEKELVLGFMKQIKDSLL